MQDAHHAENPQHRRGNHPTLAEHGAEEFRRDGRQAQEDRECDRASQPREVIEEAAQLRPVVLEPRER